VVDWNFSESSYGVGRQSSSMCIRDNALLKSRCSALYPSPPQVPRRIEHTGNWSMFQSKDTATGLCHSCQRIMQWHIECRRPLLCESCQSEKLQNFIRWNKKARTERCQRKASSRYNFQSVTGYEMLAFLDPRFRNSDHTFRILLYKRAWFDDIACINCLELCSDQVSRKVMFSNFCHAAFMHECKWPNMRTWQGVFQYKNL
jgi:hypothetical protein